jgi:nucleotide-binding universal stress UspA family protein
MTNNNTGAIVVGVDGTELGSAALRWATDEAQRRGCPLRVVTVAPAPQLAHTTSQPQEWAYRAGEQTVAAAAQHPTVHIRHRTVSGAPGRALVEASRDAALLVVGSRGAGMLARALLGSVSAYCVNHAHCPVVIVPARRPATERTDTATDGALMMAGTR